MGLDAKNNGRAMLRMIRRQESKRGEEPATQPPGESEILGLDFHALGTDRCKVRVFEIVFQKERSVRDRLLAFTPENCEQIAPKNQTSGTGVVCERRNTASSLILASMPL